MSSNTPILMKILERLDKMDTRFDNIETRLDNIETQLDKVYARLDKLDSSVSLIQHYIVNKMEPSITAIQKYIKNESDIQEANSTVLMKNYLYNIYPHANISAFPLIL